MQSKKHQIRRSGDANRKRFMFGKQRQIVLWLSAEPLAWPLAWPLG